MVNNNQDSWREAAHQKFEAFLDHIAKELPKDASIADIERLLLKHENQLMSDTFELLVNHPELSPPRSQRDT